MPHLYTILLAILFMPALLWGESKYRMAQESCGLSFIVKNKLILVQGEAGDEAGYFLFDTGASELVLNKRYFGRQRGYESDHQYTDVHGHRGQHGYVFVSHFQWGGLERDHFYTPRLDLSPLEAMLGERIIGIIGYDVLRNVETVVDYYTGSMQLFRIDEIPFPSADGRQPDFIIPFQLDGHLPVIRGAAGEAGKLRLGVDSGASVNLFEIRLRDKLAGKALQQRTIPLLGAGGGEKRTPYFVMENLQVEDAYFIHYSRVALSDLAMLRNFGFQVDGLIGVNFFRLGRVSINYRSRCFRVWLGQNDYTMRLQSVNPVKIMSLE